MDGWIVHSSLTLSAGNYLQKGALLSLDLARGAHVHLALASGL